MKTMTCKQLGGACNFKFQAETFEEMAKLSHVHGVEMKEKVDADHLAAMQDMMKLMAEPGAMQQWFADRKKEFEELAED